MFELSMFPGPTNPSKPPNPLNHPHKSALHGGEKHVNPPKPKIERLKGAIFPLLAGVMIWATIAIPALRPQWVGTTPLSSFFEATAWRTLLLPTAVSLGGVVLFALVIPLPLIRLGRLHVETQGFIAALSRRDYYGLFCQFPLTILFEELLFRGLIYYAGGLIWNPPYLIYLTAGLFALYHVHIFVSGGNIAITVIYIATSFWLGVFLGILLPFVGFLGVWGLHLILVMGIYFLWFGVMQKYH